MNTCVVCNEELPPEHTVCASKGCLLHFHCAGIKEATWRKTKQQEWKCPECRKVTNNNNPVTPAEMRQFMANVTEKVNRIDELKSTFDALERSVTFMSEKYEQTLMELNAYKTKMDEVEKKVEVLEKVKEEKDNIIHDLSLRMREAEQYARKCNIEIVGIPEQRNEDLKAIMANIASALNVAHSAGDIDVVHRVPSHSHGNAPPKIIAQFSSRSKRDEWMDKKRQVPPIIASDVCNSTSTQKVFLNTHLCKEWKDLLWKAKQSGRAKGYNFFRYQNGKIIAKKSREDKDGIYILSESDFCRFV